MSDRLTIAIPLHGGERWIEGIIETVGKAPSSCRIVISDATHLDDAPGRLAELFAADGRVEVVTRSESLNWIDHANLLMAEAATPYFCFMPQDDLVSPGYFDLLVSALDANPDRVLAFPTVVRKATTGRLRKRPLGEVAYRPPPLEFGQEPPEVEALKMLTGWNMALGCWRGVFRLDQAREVPQTNDCADLIWVFSIALAGNFIAVPEARYLKRLHRDSALHLMRWQGMSKALDLYRTEIEARISADPALAGQVTAEVRRYLSRHRISMVSRPLVPLGAFLLNRPRAVYE